MPRFLPSTTLPGAADAPAFAMQRRQWMAATLVGLLPAGLSTAATPAAPSMVVWKDPQCGCCGDWITHVQQAGFVVQVREDAAAQQQRPLLGMPRALASCHTGRVQGYLVEGHVPASDIQRLLRERPQALGLAVPGMPIGSPGMDGPVYGGRRDPFDVLLVLRDGSTKVWRRVA